MRTTIQLIDTLGRMFAGGRSVVLGGNIGDLHVGPEGTITGFDQVVALAAAGTGRATVRWTPATGTTQPTPPGRPTIRFSGPGPGTDLAQAALRLVRGLEQVDQPTVLLLDWADGFMGRQGELNGSVGELLSTAATDPALVRTGHRLVVVDRSGRAAEALGALPGLVRASVPLPGFDERVAFLGHFEGVHRSPEFARLASGETVEGIGRASNGMSLRVLLSLMGELRHAGRDLDAAALAPVKHDFLVQHTEGALRPLQSNRTIAEVAGLHNVKALLARWRRRPHEATGNIVLAGPPGGGKSTVAGAIADALGLTVVALGEIRSQWVGESERRTRLMIETAESMRPLMVFIDEFDQTMSGDDGPSGDSGVTQRLNAMFWSWTGEVGSEPGVTVVGATNRPEALGARVHDRFTIVPILHPDPSEALEVLRITSARMGRRLDTDAAGRILADRGALLTGRSLADLVIRAARFEDEWSSSVDADITGRAVGAALDDLLPWTNQRDEELMALQAIRHTRQRSLLPWVAARDANVPYQAPAYVRPFLDADGSVDAVGITERIAELQAGHRGR